MPELIRAPSRVAAASEPPGADGAEYISVCVPAFTPGTVHRDD